VHRLKLAEAQKDNKLNELLRESGNLEAPVRLCAVMVVVHLHLLAFAMGSGHVFARLSEQWSDPLYTCPLAFHCCRMSFLCSYVNCQ
jgi:hypothetical protein